MNHRPLRIWDKTVSEGNKPNWLEVPNINGSITSHPQWEAVATPTAMKTAQFRVAAIQILVGKVAGFFMIRELESSTVRKEGANDQEVTLTPSAKFAHPFVLEMASFISGFPKKIAERLESPSVVNTRCNARVTTPATQKRETKDKVVTFERERS